MQVKNQSLKKHPQIDRTNAGDFLDVENSPTNKF
jgi:hypothetical protein